MRHSGWDLKQELQMLPVCRDQRSAATANHLSPSNATPHHPLLSHQLPSCPLSLHPLHLLSALPLGLLPASSNPSILPFDIFIVPHLHKTSACLSLASLVLSLVFSFVSTLWQTSAASQIYFSFYPSTVNIVVLCSAFCLPFISFLPMQFASPSFCHARFPFIYLVICLHV